MTSPNNTGQDGSNLDWLGVLKEGLHTIAHVAKTVVLLGEATEQIAQAQGLFEDRSLSLQDSQVLSQMASLYTLLIKETEANCRMITLIMGLPRQKEPS